jgi:hypothetical protein
MYDAKTNKCGYSDSNSTKYTETTFQGCDTILESYNIPVIKIGKTKNNEKTNVIIEKNIFNIYTTSAKTAYEENHNFLEVLYPNIIDIETTIQNYISKVSGILNK